jgi:hypothetical protein
MHFFKQERSIITMNESSSICATHEQEKEVVNILLDSKLYLDMDLAARYRLLHFIVASYFESSAR